MISICAGDVMAGSSAAKFETGVVADVAGADIAEIDWARAATANAEVGLLSVIVPITVAGARLRLGLREGGLEPERDESRRAYLTSDGVTGFEARGETESRLHEDEVVPDLTLCL